MNPDLQRLALARGNVVVNTGVYATYSKQLLDVAFGRAFDSDHRRQRPRAARP